MRIKLLNQQRVALGVPQPSSDFFGFEMLFFRNLHGVCCNAHIIYINPFSFSKLFHCPYHFVIKFGGKFV